MTNSTKLSKLNTYGAGIVLSVSLILPTPVFAATVIAGTGATSTDILDEVTNFQNALGQPNNGNAPGPLPDGRRQIGWDAAAGPFDMPPDAFQFRGTIFSTNAGSEFRQSNPVDGVTPDFPPGGDNEFSSFNPTYPDQFTTFSPSRLFAPVGTNVMEVTFVIPGTDIPATVNGFGAVFTDVDLANTTKIEYFDIKGNLLASEFVDPFAEGLSFLGVTFDEPSIFRVEITTGNTALGPNDDPGNGVDVVVMDDFLFSEPQAVPVPESSSLLGLLTLGVCGAGLLYKRRHT